MDLEPSFIRERRTRTATTWTPSTTKTNLLCLTGLTVALACGTYARAENVLDDFADGDLFDCEPLCWSQASCCPVDFRPRENGIDFWQTSSAGAWVFANDLTSSRDPGVRIRARVTLGTLESSRGPNLGFSSVSNNGATYVANYRNEFFRLRLDGGGGELKTEPVQLDDLDFSQPIDVELELGPTTVEMRMWQALDERPAEPSLSLEHASFLVGNPGFSVFDDAREPIIVHEVEVTDLGPRPLHFLRGDCNDDGEVDITDGILMLGFSFLREESPLCLSACDFNGSGALDITTAVYVFNYLFAGGPAPPSPFPGCGPATAGDEALGCATRQNHCP